MVSVVILEGPLKICAVLDLLFEGELSLVLPVLLKVVLFALDELLRFVKESVLVVDDVLGLECPSVPLVLGVVPEIVLLQRVLLVERVLLVLYSLTCRIPLVELLFCT